MEIDPSTADQISKSPTSAEVDVAMNTRKETAEAAANVFAQSAQPVSTSVPEIHETDDRKEVSQTDTSEESDDSDTSLTLNQGHPLMMTLRHHLVVPGKFEYQLVFPPYQFNIFLTTK